MKRSLITGSVIALFVVVWACTRNAGIPKGGNEHGGGEKAIPTKPDAGGGEKPARVELVCEAGTDPIISPLPTFDADCPPLAAASKELCNEHDLLYSVKQQLCIKAEDCTAPFVPVDGECTGSGSGGGVGCSSPTPVQRCIKGTTVCWCSST